MKLFFLQIFFSFVTGTFFSILNNIQRKYCLLCGVLGMSTWIVYTILPKIFNISLPLSALITAVTLSFIANIIAKKIVIPTSVLSISGIITIVPGGLFFNCLNFFAHKDFNSAYSAGSQVIMIGIALSIGLMFNGVFHIILKKSFIHQYLKENNKIQ